MSTEKLRGEIPQTDEWVWGKERIVWGFSPEHKYTFKILEPKKGRDGCLSLQYHHEKSESWLVLRGLVWAMVVVDGEVCTRIMRPGEIQNLTTGSIHRLMGLSDDAQVAEPSTPDKHAADKSVPKDVVRLHCVQGRECSVPRDQQEEAMLKKAIDITEAAIVAIESGGMPDEINPERMISNGALRVP